MAGKSEGKLSIKSFVQAAQGLYRHIMNSEGYKWPVIFSLSVHVLFIVLFTISSFMTDRKVLVKPPEINYVKTMVLQKTKAAPKPKVDKAAQKKKEEEKIKEIRRKKQQKQAEEKKRIAAQKAKEKKELEEKKKEDAKKKEQERLEKEKLEKEKQEKENKEKERQEQVEKQRKQREAYQNKIREQRRQAEILRKQQELDRQREAAQADADQEVVDAYEAQIQSKIAQNWSRPLSARNGMQTTLQIHLIPGGEVVNVKIIESSGDALFDRSATQAVWQASPLPVPKDTGVFSRNYRVFNLLFAPEDLWQ